MTSTTTNMTTTDTHQLALFYSTKRLAAALLMSAGFLVAPSANSQETVCARVKIEIKQELTLERQGFDAQMKINNTTASGAIENVSVVIKVSDESRKIRVPRDHL
jgi:tRNA A37 threonylcarbamoyladenosine synthetase subunit TsaC/SUA5/YrdC